MRLFEKPQKPFLHFFLVRKLYCLNSSFNILSRVFFDLTLTFAFLLFIKAVLSFDNKKYLLPSTFRKKNFLFIKIVLNDISNICKQTIYFGLYGNKKLKHGHMLIFISLRSTLLLVFYLLVRALRSDIIIFYI